MTNYRLWIYLAAAVAATAFSRPTTAQEARPEIKYYVVANATPPDAFLALRTDPSPKTGSRIEVMPNGTVLEVLKTNPNGWWYVRVVASGKEGWALSGQNDKHWIVCCVAAPKIDTATVSAPVVNETRAIGPPSPTPAPSPQNVSQASSPIPEKVKSNETILEQCAAEAGGFSGTSDPRSVEVWRCVKRMQEEQAVQLGERACNDYLCLFRLAFVSEGAFSGSGYILKYRVSSRLSKFGNLTITTYDSVLTAENGKQTVLRETIGPIGSIFIDAAGPLAGPFGTGANSYIVLRLPKDIPTPDENRPNVTSQPCQTASSDPIPCELKWKTVEVKFGVVSRTGSFRSDGTEMTAPQNRRDIEGAMSEKLVFGSNGDVYVFFGREEGFVYKINLEIDFLANPSRLPKDDHQLTWLHQSCMKTYKGRMDFRDDTLTMSNVSENSCDWNSSSNSTLQIRFSADLSSCSVVGFSSTQTDINPDRSSYMTHKQNFNKSVECRMYSAK
jgi:hypothetical protein